MDRWPKELFTLGDVREDQSSRRKGCGSFGCTASIIAPEWVLSAKHCGGDGVRVGNINLGQGEQRAIVQRIDNPATDMMLLRLESGVDTSVVSPSRRT